MGRKAKRIDLDEEQYKTLSMWKKSLKIEKRLSQRANVILLASEGKSLKDISKDTDLSWQNCLKWRSRFQEYGVEGLRDKQGRGRPARIAPEKKVSIIALACSKPPKGNTRWSCRKLAEHTGVSSATVCRILNKGQIKPHKVQYWCGRSTDPEFEEKQAAIIGLYLNPPENALVLSIDEKSQIQALDRTQPVLPMKVGRSKRLTSSYKRHGTTCLLATLAVHEGNIKGRCVQKHTHQEFLSFLKHLYRQYPYKHLHVILDNFSAHKQKNVMQWVKKDDA